MICGWKRGTGRGRLTQEYAPDRDAPTGLPTRGIGQGGHGRDWAARGATINGTQSCGRARSVSMTKHIYRYLSDPVWSIP